ncbi:hypothetical protein LSTR_LSTR011561 [Laodelphax striatellus]|uniref:Uncharacterized protein n=1 Tax=Laodelphax striatellus TaxID=195883 RepID=A0A482X9K1_LAOST|nr:hypothetical protein LSTR_LSTR011561 [Laodelphax striatellus]
MMLNRARNHSDNASGTTHRTLTRHYDTRLKSAKYPTGPTLSSSIPIYGCYLVSHPTMQTQAQYHISHHCTMVKTCTFTSALHGGAAIKAPTKTETTLIAKLA